jgi:V/A-type H+-transporting ATPase subunit I
MNKVSLVVMDKEKDSALEALRDLGVLHIEHKSVQSDGITRLTEQKIRAENALALLRQAEDAAKKQKEKGGSYGGADPVAEILALGEAQKNLKEGILSLGRERARLEKWGDFDPAAFAELAEKGVALVPYELTPRAYEAAADAPLIVLAKDKGSVRVVSVGGELDGETPFAVGEKSLSDIDRALARGRAELAASDKKLRELLPAKAAVEETRKKILEQLEFETARAEMEKLEAYEEAPADFSSRTVSWISGFVPEEKLGVLKRGAAEHGWALLADEPSPDDQVPTLLKNGKFASLLNPLTDFLEVVPGYNEVDISPFFLFFFCIFFGMIFGDAGYGALLFLAGIVSLVKTAKKGPPVMCKLLVLLGFSNLLWGVLTCSWFGIDAVKLPEFLQKISLPLISNVSAAASERGKSLVQQNLMIFCFSLALIHLSIGHILAIIKNRSLRALAGVGNICMLAGMYFIVISLIASNAYRQIPLYMAAVYVFAAGFVLNFIFGNYEGSVGRSVRESCVNIISVILGIANIFSDIMSYIRLWAVGLAGAAIASTVNSLAGPLLGHFVLFFAGGILLVFGHGLNIVLNVLSVLVHGVRLNTLEFSGHAGLTWSGFAYKPFSKRVIKEAE